MSILWGQDRDLDYWTALHMNSVPDAERRAMALLASISDEKRFSFYCMAGMFPAMGNVTKRIYFIRRWTTVLELEDGVPRASWCILANDRMIAPETDHVVAMKNILEGSEMAFRQVGNAFHYAYDPSRGRVEAKTEFMNPYLAPIGPDKPARDPKDISEWHEDASLLFRDREGWVKTLTLKAELDRELAVERFQNPIAKLATRRQIEAREELVERAREWVRIPSKEKMRLKQTHFERQMGRTMGALQGMAGGFVNNAGGITTTNASIFSSNATAQPFYFNIA